jgi:hypothetical protein
MWKGIANALKSIFNAVKLAASIVVGLPLLAVQSAVLAVPLMGAAFFDAYKTHRRKLKGSQKETLHNSAAEAVFGAISGLWKASAAASVSAYTFVGGKLQNRFDKILGRDLDDINLSKINKNSEAFSKEILQRRIDNIFEKGLENKDQDNLSSADVSSDQSRHQSQTKSSTSGAIPNSEGKPTDNPRPSSATLVTEGRNKGNEGR